MMTKDNNNTGLWVGLGLAVGLGIGLYLGYQNKDKIEELKDKLEEIISKFKKKKG